jgi:hypothetical protein
MTFSATTVLSPYLMLSKEVAGTDTPAPAFDFL